MSRPIAYGIDFGTTNTLLSVARDDGAELLEVDGNSELLPSVIYLHRDAIRSAGTGATRQYSYTGAARHRCGSCSLVRRDRRGVVLGTDCHAYRAGSGCHDSRLITEMKRALADSEYDETHSWARTFDTPDIIATIFRALKRAADKAVGDDVKRAVIGHPVAFEGAQGRGFADKQRMAKSRLRMAAQQAGFSEVELLEEPAAAVSLEDEDGIVLAADFGGGTFDVSIIDITGAKGRVRALAGVPVGGEDFDGLLFQHALFPVLGLEDGDGLPIPNRYRSAFGRRSRAIRMLTDRDLPAILADAQRCSGSRQGIQRLRQIVDRGWIYDLYRAVEEAKQRLSEAEATRVQFDRAGVELDVPVTRRAFEQWISPRLTRVQQTVLDALGQANLAAEDVDLVVCTGGSSRIPAFQTLLEDLFGAEKIRQRDPYATIALGLGLHARRLWRE